MPSGSLGRCCCYCWGKPRAEAGARARPPGLGAEPCTTLVQGKFFGYFSAAAVFPAMRRAAPGPCAAGPAPLPLYMKVAKTPPAAAPPASAPTSSTPSWSPRTYLGVESFDEVLRLC